MSRTTLILISVLGVVAIGGGAYLWMNKDNLKLSPTTNTVNTNVAAQVNGNTNTVTAANLNLSTTQVFQGDKTLDKQLTVAGTALHITSTLKVDTYEGVAAPKGQQYLVIYFDPIDGGSVLAVQKALVKDAHLLAVGKSQIALAGIKMATTVIKNDVGFINFLVPSAATGLVLEIGTGSTAQHAALAY